MAKNKAGKSSLLWLILSVLFGVSFIFQLIGLTLVTFTSLSILYEGEYYFLNLFVGILLYFLFIFSRHRYTNRAGDNKFTLTKKNVLLIAFIILIGIIYLVRANSTSLVNDNDGTAKEWQDFKAEASDHSSFIDQPTQESFDTLGCFNEAGEPKDGFCKFMNYEYYVPEDNQYQYLRDNLRYLLDQNYTFLSSPRTEPNRFTNEYIDSIKEHDKSIILVNRDISRTVVIDFADRAVIKWRLRDQPLQADLQRALESGATVYSATYHTM